MSDKKITTALISVYHKENLEPIIRKLSALNVQLLATGGTQKFIETLNIKVTPVEDITGFPSILGGRVKTLHPKIFGAILSRKDNSSDDVEMKKFNLPSIELVIVDLYPFEETVASGAGEEEIIEQIDIGGISLIRASAKNHNDVLIIPSREEYSYLNKLLEEKKGYSSLDDRKKMAVEAFRVSSQYDSAIFEHFRTSNSKKNSISRKLRYGENPHQQGIFYGNFDELFDQLHGKEISYNNLLDIDAAVSLISEFDEPTVAIIKHNNACGFASSIEIDKAWQLALQADPVSAFGGIVCMNRKIETKLALEIDKIFIEVLIAPEYDEEALKILTKKKNRIILIQKKTELPVKIVRTVLNGIVEQDRDSQTENMNDMRLVTLATPTLQQFADLGFANKIVKHLKSNAIVIAKNGQLLGSGTGQTSRVDALNHAIEKAKHFGFDLKDSVMASDAFFPFPDCVEIAGQAGITAIIQPGGSVKDQESIDYCNCHHLAMVVTGYRHFKH